MAAAAERRPQHSTKALRKVRALLLKNREGERGRDSYRVPSLWRPPGVAVADGKAVEVVNPYDFHIAHIDAIIAHGTENPPPRLKEGTGGDWVRRTSLYSFTPRVTAAFDHDGDGIIGGSPADITRNRRGERETGTFLKSIALLGHISRLGCNALYLLPITSIGKDGNKGELGSPYAIRNPYKIDPLLADPLVNPSMDLQCAAFVEACHLMGIYVVLEFVFRTASKDADWVREHPEWFYWIDAAVPGRERGETDVETLESTYGNPYFTAGELDVITRKVNSGDLADLPAPHERYRKMFVLPPEGPGKVRKARDGSLIGRGKDPSTGKEVAARIPGAFADWPPDDIQPPWTDVTYLRMYTEPAQRQRFNYIAYNTIRMYDSSLATKKHENRPLWDRIVGIIPHYQDTFGIDGVLIDMGHAMPPALMKEMIDTARERDRDFTVLSENFHVDEESRRQGFNAVMGYSWSASHRRDGILKLLDHAGVQGMPIPFMATAENHNTPRAAARPGGIAYAKLSHLLHSLVPNGIAFIHSGFELGETEPFNTGLDFTPEELERFKDRKLPLFDIAGFDWRAGELVPFIEKVAAIRREYREIILDTSRDSFALVDTGNPQVVGFARSGARNGAAVTLLSLLNTDYDSPGDFRVSVGAKGKRELADRIAGATFPLTDGTLEGTLLPGQGALLTMENR